MKEKIKKIKLSNESKVLIAIAVFLILFVSGIFIRRTIVLKNPSVTELIKSEKAYLNSKIADKKYERSQVIHQLPYGTVAAKLDINAASAILINADTGDILFEKNADEEIPPASMTKLFLMYTVFQKISEGKATLDDVVPLPPECWASNMPPHSSLMFLGKGQTVTLRELLVGLAVCSGNDASHAIAYYLFGSIDTFLEEVNNQIKLCGLEKTHIVEPSGYSENNVTTAREMASFARIYINRYPDSLKEFHSVRKFVYPTQKNIAPEDLNKSAQIFKGVIPDSIWTPIEQENTNKLLKSLEGCDGLKTGYIDESGYNLSLTCERFGERYLSVTMKGPGENVIEGDKYRVLDGTTLQEFAFGNFIETRDFSPEETEVITPVLGAKQNAVKLVVPYEIKTCIPAKIFDSADVQVKKIVKPVMYGEIKAGEEYGKLSLSINGLIIEEVPLVADRDIERAFFIKYFFDKIVYHTIR